MYTHIYVHVNITFTDTDAHLYMLYAIYNSNSLDILFYCVLVVLEYLQFLYCFCMYHII